MEEIKKPILNEQTAAPEEEMKLDDARRVKVLSPGMLVFKRFIRNKLAIAGTIILVVMFLFAFVGPLFTPYSIAQQFTDTNAFQWSEYATVMYNNELRYTVQAGKTFSKADQTALMLAFSNYRKSHNNAALPVGEDLEFTSGNNVYYVETLNPAVPSYVVRVKEDLATVGVGKINIVAEEYANDPGLEAELKKLSVPMAPTSGEFEYDGKKIAFLRDGQLWKMNADGSSRVQLTDSKIDIEGFKFSPDGKQVIIVKSLPFHDIIQKNPDDLPKATGRKITDLMYRHWDHYVESIQHPFLASVSEDGTIATANAKPLRS